MHHFEKIAQRRRSRHARLPKARRKSFILQERDILIARYVHKYRFLNSHHIRALISGNDKKITERLAQLYDQDIIAKPSLKSGLAALYKPAIYELGRIGGKLLKERGFLNIAAQRWIAKNREGTSRSITHTLMIADLMVSIEISCRSHPCVELIEPSQIIQQAPSSTRASDNPFCIPAHARYLHPDTMQVHDVPTGVIPDKVFGLRNLTSETVQYFFLEADTGSVSLTDKNQKRHTVLRRISAYMQMANRGTHTRHFNIPQFIVLFVTSSAQRAQHMLELVDHLTQGNGSPRFLFRTHPASSSSDQIVPAIMSTALLFLGSAPDETILHSLNCSQYRLIVIKTNKM